MTDSDIIERGLQAQKLLQDRTFIDVVRSLFDQYHQTIFATAPESTAERERVYYQFKALQEIMAELASRHVEALELINSGDDRDPEEQPSEELADLPWLSE